MELLFLMLELILGSHAIRETHDFQHVCRYWHLAITLGRINVCLHDQIYVMMRDNHKG